MNETGLETPPLAPGDPAGSRVGWKAALPWLGAVAVLAYLFWEVPLRDVWMAAQGARLDWFVPTVGIGILYWFLLDSWAYAYLISRFNAPLSWSEARAMRGVTYLIAAVNWNVGTAAIVLYLRRFKQVPALESTSSIFFYENFSVLALVTLAFLGASSFGGEAEIQQIQGLSGWMLLVGVAVLTLLLGSQPNWSWLQRLRGWALFRSFRLTRPRDIAILLFIRVSYIVGFLTAFYIGAHSFGIEIPVSLALASVPVVLIAGALPITPAGLGTQAATMLFFWEDYGDPAAIVAFGLVFPIALTTARVVLGLPYLSELRRLRQPD